MREVLYPEWRATLELPIREGSTQAGCIRKGLIREGAIRKALVD
jgi:hypothetical protein